MTERDTVVCFDLGGVVVRICRTWAEACERSSLPVRDAEWLRSEGWRERRKRVVDDYQRGAVDCQAYYDALSEAVDGLYSAREVEAIHRVWTQEEYPGIASLIDELNALEGVRTACLSNTNHAHWERLDGGDGRAEYPAVQKLGTRLASHRLGLLKPGREIYRAANAALAGGRDSQVIFFDDLPDNVEAARRSGWSAHVVDHAGDTASQVRRLLVREHGLPLETTE